MPTLRQMVATDFRKTSCNCSGRIRGPLRTFQARWNSSERRGDRSSQYNRFRPISHQPCVRPEFHRTSGASNERLKYGRRLAARTEGSLDGANRSEPVQTTTSSPFRAHRAISAANLLSRRPRSPGSPQTTTRRNHFRADKIRPGQPPSGYFSPRVSQPRIVKSFLADILPAAHRSIHF